MAGPSILTFEFKVTNRLGMVLIIKIVAVPGRNQILFLVNFDHFF